MACGCRLSSIALPTVSSRRCRSRRRTGPPTGWRTQAASRNAKRLGVSRRDFSRFRPAARRARCSPSTPRTPLPESAAAFSISSQKPLSSRSSRRRRVGGKGEFIFDVQGHFVDPTGAWVKTAPADAFKWSPKASCGLAAKPGRAVISTASVPRSSSKTCFSTAIPT